MEKDPAFMWETEALRSGRHEVRSTVVAAPSAAAEQIAAPQARRPDRWVTPDEAAAETGISLDTLVKWMLTETVRSQLDMTVDPPVRKINLASLPGRRPGPDPQAAAAGPPPVVRSAPGTSIETGRTAQPATDTGRAAPPGTLIVPIAAWDKMLMQLGNLHEAGKELAAARERAAKAETEASFLRERLAELRAEIADKSAQAERAAAEAGRAEEDLPGPVPPTRAVPASPESSPPEPLWRSLYDTLRRQWRHRR